MDRLWILRIASVMCLGSSDCPRHHSRGRLPFAVLTRLVLPTTFTDIDNWKGSVIPLETLCIGSIGDQQGVVGEVPDFRSTILLSQLFRASHRLDRVPLSVESSLHSRTNIGKHMSNTVVSETYMQQVWNQVS
jgi:hypothetical protein